MVDMEESNWSLHIKLLLLVSVSTLSKANIVLPDYCKNMLGNPNVLCEKKLI